MLVLYFTSQIVYISHELVSISHELVPITYFRLVVTNGCFRNVWLFRARNNAGDGALFGPGGAKCHRPFFCAPTSHFPINKLGSSVLCRTKCDGSFNYIAFLTSTLTTLLRSGSSLCYKVNVDLAEGSRMHREFG